MRIYLPGYNTSYLNPGIYNIRALIALTKINFWENWNSNFVQLNTMTIFTTLYEIMGITGGEIYLRFKDGATVGKEKS